MSYRQSEYSSHCLGLRSLLVSKLNLTQHGPRGRYMVACILLTTDCTGLVAESADACAYISYFSFYLTCCEARVIITCDKIVPEDVDIFK